MRFCGIFLLILTLSTPAGAQDVFDDLRPQNVPLMIQGLAKPEFSEQASLTLVKIGAPAVPALVEVVARHDSQSIQAANVLGRIGPAAEDAVPVLVESLRLRSLDQRRAAAQALLKIGRPAVPALIRALQDQDRRQRELAARVLAEFGPLAEEATDALITALRTGGDDGLVRFWAAAALGKIGPQAARGVPALIDSLETFEGNDRAVAVRALGEMGPAARAAVPALIKIVKEDNGLFNTETAGQALVQIGGPAFPALIEMLHDEQRKIRQSAEKTLVLAGKRAAPKLVEAFEVPDAKFRQRVSEILVQIGEPAVADLLGALKSRDRSIRFAAGLTLAQIEAAGHLAVEEMVANLWNPDLGVRIKAVETLGSIGPAARDAVSPLIEAFRISDEAARAKNIPVETWQNYLRLVSRSLAQIGEPAAPELIAALKDKDTVVRDWASLSLAMMGDEAVPELVRALLDEDRTGEIQVLWALKQIAPSGKTLARFGPDGVPALLRMLRTRDTEMRGRAAEGLARLGRPAVPGLVAALRANDLGVRFSAVQALGAMGPAAKDAIPSLLASIVIQNKEPALADVPKEKWRAYLRVNAQALENIGPEAADRLIQAVQYKDPVVRYYAASAMGMTGEVTERTVPALAEALKDDSPDVRMMAAATLGRLGREAKAAVPALIESIRMDDPALKSQDVSDYFWDNYRKLAADTIAKIGRSAVPDLVEALSHDNSFVRQHVAWALLKINPGSSVYERIGAPAVPGLIESLDDGDVYTRVAAIEAIAQIGTEAAAATPKLIHMYDTIDQVAKDEDFPPGFRDYYLKLVDNALFRIGKPAVAELVKRYLDENETVRDHVGRVLLKIGPDADTLVRTGDASVAELLEAFKVVNRRLGRSAENALVAIGEPAVPGLMELLKGRDVTLRDKAEQALIRIGEPAAPQLIAALQDERAYVRMAAARALGGDGPADRDKIPAANVVPALVATLDDEDEQVRRYAARSLKWIAPEEAAKHDIE